jgi:hypothetical protein
MFVVIGFAIDKRSGLIDIYKKKIEEDRRVEWRKESLSRVIGTTNQLFVLWPLIRTTLRLLTSGTAKCLSDIKSIRLNLFGEVTCVCLNEKKGGSEVEMKHGQTRGRSLNDEAGRSLFWHKNWKKTKKEESNLQIR